MTRFGERLTTEWVRRILRRKLTVNCHTLGLAGSVLGSDRQTADRIGRLETMATRTRDRHATVWVCVDCMYAQAGIGEEERGEPFPDGVLSLIGPTEDVTAGMMAEDHDTPCGSFDEDGTFLGGECECETQSFSWSPCEGCGSSLGGSRHALTVWWE